MTQRMMSEKSGPLESGSREARYVLVDENGVHHGHADTLADARERRERIDLDRTVHVVLEHSQVIPDALDATDADHLELVDAARVHEALAAARAILDGEAGELDARRPHPPAYAFLYDSADTLRHRAERTDVVKSELERTPDKPHITIPTLDGVGQS